MIFCDYYRRLFLFVCFLCVCKFLTVLYAFFPPPTKHKIFQVPNKIKVQSDWIVGTTSTKKKLTENDCFDSDMFVIPCHLLSVNKPDMQGVSFAENHGECCAWYERLSHRRAQRFGMWTKLFTILFCKGLWTSTQRAETTAYDLCAQLHSVYN